ncbi:MAG: leucine-rich repeat domain-containing protein [Saprospiraceae bacterium]|nr:leucine-rich repeat domain-containing protein [Candidatus Vicinibacter affinis]
MSEDESKEALQLAVNAGNCGGIDQVDRIAKALVRVSKPHWRLVLWIGSNGLESVPESVWELANLEELGLNSNKLKTLSPAIAKLTKLRRLWIGEIHLRAFRKLCASWSNWRFCLLMAAN